MQRYISLSKIKEKGQDANYIKDYGIKHYCPYCYAPNYFGLTEYNDLVHKQKAITVCTSCKQKYTLFTDE